MFGVRHALTHADMQRERELTHAEYTERELTHIKSILVNLYVSEQFCIGEEQFSYFTT